MAEGVPRAARPTPLDAGPYVGVAHSEQGPVRPSQQDAWRFLPHVAHADRPRTAVAVFDGVGGSREGGKAARAAADGLEEALRTASVAEDVIPVLNRRLDDIQGSTTAVIALLDAGGRRPGVILITVGDSSAYVEEDGRVVRLNPHDLVERNILSDFLGHPGARGHVTSFRLLPGTQMLLCTDGVDGVVGRDTIQAALRADTPGQAIDLLFAEVRALGAPDNATAIVLRRTA